MFLSSGSCDPQMYHNDVKMSKYCVKNHQHMGGGGILKSINLKEFQVTLHQ